MEGPARYLDVFTGVPEGMALDGASLETPRPGRENGDGKYALKDGKYSRRLGAIFAPHRGCSCQSERLALFRKAYTVVGEDLGQQQRKKPVVASNWG